MAEMHHPDGWAAKKVQEYETVSHGLNYHHPNAGKLGYQFYMPPGEPSSCQKYPVLC